MREKDFSTGLRGTLFEQQHYARMGAALWLFGWLVLRQTHQHGELGWVLGGKAITYREIQEETGFNRRTLEGWMRTLRREGYVVTQAMPAGVVVCITKAKKFVRGVRPPAGRPRQPADAGRNLAGTPPPGGVGAASQRSAFAGFAPRISSSGVGGAVEREKTTASWLGKSQTPGDGRVPPMQQNWLSPRRPETPQRPPQTMEFEGQILPIDIVRMLLREQQEARLRAELDAGAGPEVGRR